MSTPKDRVKALAQRQRELQERLREEAAKLAEEIAAAERGKQPSGEEER